MRYRFVPLAFFIAIVAGLLLSGCWPSEPERKYSSGPRVGFPNRTTPENVLSSLRIIYGDKDSLVTTPEHVQYWAEKYRELFHPDSSVFKFYFVLGEAPPSAPNGWWGIEEEVTSFDGLLSAVVSGLVADIRLEWTVNPSVPDNRVDDYGQPLHPDWRWIHVTSIWLDVDCGEVIFGVTGGVGDFYFGPDPADSTLWVVTEWIDRPVDLYITPTDVMAVELTTWGKIKGLFYG